jgi:hypothetical protein
MRRLTFVAALAALAVLAAGVSATTAAAKTRHRVALTAVGAQIGPGDSVYDVHGTARGALVQLFQTNADATGGTSTSTFSTDTAPRLAARRSRAARRMPAGSSPSPEPCAM